MCFDICTINMRVSIRVRGLHLVVFGHLLSHGFVVFLSLFCRFLVVFYLIALFFRVFCQFPPALQLGGRCPIFGFPASMFEFCCSPFAACTVTFFPFSWLRHSFLPFFVVLWSSHVLLSRVVSCVALSCFFTSIFWWWSCGGLSLRSRPTNSANTDLHKAFGNEFTFTHLFENGNV